MNRFWQTLIINAIIRALSGVFLVLVSKGYLTSREGEIVALTVATILFNVAQTAFNMLLNRWHVNLGRLADPNASTAELVSVADQTGTLTKLKQSIGPRPTAEEIGLPPPSEDARDTQPLERQP